MESPKQYSIEMDSSGPFVHAVVSGAKVTPQIALDYWHEIIDKCESIDCSKILLEHDFVEMISMQEMLEIIGPVGELLQGRSMAFYDRFGHYDIPEAGKMILRSQHVKMQIFHDLEEAKKWLLAN